MSHPIEAREILTLLEACDPKWLAHVLFYRQQTDPILENLCRLKIGIEKAKQGDLEALRLGLESALDLPESHRRSFLSDDFDLVLTQSTEDLASLRNLSGYKESIRPLLETFILRAASVSTEFEEGFSWWHALEDLCARLNLPVPEAP